MEARVDRLIRELLAWIAERPRTYGEVMDAWRSSCPRHPVWDDALAAGLVQVTATGTMSQDSVTLTPKGYATLDGVTWPAE